MPTVEYSNLIRKIKVSRGMITPKKIQDLSKWLKQAQISVKEIPRNIASCATVVDRSISPDMSWFVSDEEVSVKYIRFDIENLLGEKAHIVINRSTNSMGV